MLLQTSRNVRDVHPGDHICHIYKQEQERDALLIPFIRDGLARHEQVLCILDTLSAEALLARLDGDLSGTYLPYVTSEQLVFLGSDEFYAAQSGFDVSATLDKFCGRRQFAQEAGYTGLRVVSEMSWTLRYTTDIALLMAYESQLNERLPKSGCIMLCLYDERRFGSKTLSAMLRVHPTSTQGDVLCDNRAYVVYTHRLPTADRAVPPVVPPQRGTGQIPEA